MIERRLHHLGATALAAFRGAEPLPGGIVLGIGCAPGAVAAGREVLAAIPRARVMAVNDAIGSQGSSGVDRAETWPCDLEFAGSAHGGHLAGWLEGRGLDGLNRPAHVVSLFEDHVDSVTILLRELNFSPGSSGMLPVLLGNFVLKAAAVVLCGVALRDRYARYLKAWREARGLGLLGNVYSATPSALLDEGLARPWTANPAAEAA